MPDFIFEGTARWKGETESDVIVKGKSIAVISPPLEFGGKAGYIVPEELFAASLDSCMNTLFLLIAGNSNLKLKSLETKAIVNMKVEGLERLIFTNIHFQLTVSLEKDTKWEREKAKACFEMAQKICPLRQSWGESVPISFKLIIK